MLTFQQLCAAYLGYLAGRASHENQVRLHRQFFANWTEHPTKKHIKAWHRAGKATPSHSDKGLGFLNAMYNWAINELDDGKWEGENPAAGIDRHGSSKRDRVILGYELTALIAAFPFASRKFSAFLTILLTTGCRMSEARVMRWQHVDAVNGCWLKPTTKNGDPQRLPLCRQACAILRQIWEARPEGSANPYVFAGQNGKPWSRAAAEKCWSGEQIRSKGGKKTVYPSFRDSIKLSDVRLHDFRRTVASGLYAITKDTKLVKAVLNHRRGDVTDIYIKVPFEEQAKALQAHADRLFGESGESAIACMHPLPLFPIPPQQAVNQ